MKYLHDFEPVVLQWMMFSITFLQQGWKRRKRKGAETKLPSIAGPANSTNTGLEKGF